MKRVSLITIISISSFFILFLSGNLKPPVVEAAFVSPNKAYPGDVITIYYDTNDCLETGSGSVEIGGIPVSVQSWYACIGQISIIVPFNLKSGDVIVHTRSGTTENVGYLYIYEPPVITSISPSSVIPGKTLVTIYGSGFGDQWYYGSDLYFNGVVADKISLWTDTQIQALVPAGVKAGNISIKISPFDMVYGPSFSIQGPEIYSMSPTVVIPGVTKVVIKGNYFGDKWYVGDDLYFNNVPVKEGRDVISWTDTEITTYVPLEVTSGGNISIKRASIGASIVYGPSFSLETNISNDPLSIIQKRYLKLIKVPESWSIITGSRDVVVAIIDDGVYINHPDLKDNIWINNKEQIGNGKDDDGNGYVDDIYGWDFVSNEGEMTVRGSHGTMVAGVLGAIGNNGIGIAGVSWQVKIMSLIVCDNRIGCPMDGIIKAIKYAADNGANIINLSLGTNVTTGYTTTLDEVISYAYNKGTVIVAAAGNGDIEGGLGQDLNIIPQSPVCNDNGQNMIIGVGAVNDDGYRSVWSNYGNCVDIYAPGDAIISTSAPIYSTREGFYDVESGTSFSAPMISGIAALLKAKYPTMPNYEIRDRIIKNASGGIVNAYVTLSELYTPPPIIKKPDSALIKTANSPIVYLVENGQRRSIPDIEVFNSLGYKWENIVVISEEEMNSYPLGLPMTHRGPVNIPGHSLVKLSNSPDIYAIFANTKRKIRSLEIFNSYDWSNQKITTVSQNYLDAIPETTLIKTPDNPNVYVLEKGFKRLLASVEIFNSYNLNWGKIVTISQAEMNSYTIVPLIKHGNDLYWLDANRIIHRFPSMESLTRNGYNIRDAITINDLEFGGYAEGIPINN